MDDHTLQVLEFHKVLARLAGFAVSAPGRAALLAVRPFTDAEEIRRRQRLTDNVRRLHDGGRSLPLEGIHDLQAAFLFARAEDAILEAVRLLEIADELQAARILRAAILGVEADIPDLKALARSLAPVPLLEEALRDALAEDGAVNDRASVELRAIRQSARATEEGIRSRIEAILRLPGAGNFLSDAFVTQRDGRYVLPVKATSRGAVRGIVHDRSDSGNTVFVEPEETVELGNELRDLRARERVEVQRILRLLTARVGRELHALELNHVLLVELDFYSALARFAAEFRMASPQIAERPMFQLVQARHPLLLFAGHPTVAIDVSVGENCRTLVITGPNTGGKTVTLKTVGLLVLLAQAGLPVPADPTSRLGVFERIYCDIGDEQSIEQSLSTFSAHLTRIIAILAAADGSTLALLDELGAGTDPVEGGALGEAILERLQEQGALSIATTHLSDLKLLAHSSAGMKNASVAFDAETLRPTYQLLEGLPGNSNALIIARRLGMPASVIERAKSAVGEQRVDLERIIRDLHGQRGALEQEREAVAKARAGVLALEEKLGAQLAAWKSEKAKLKESARAEAEELVDGARRDVDEILAELKAKAKADVPAPARAEARRRVEKVAGEVARKGADADAVANPRPASAPILPGARVRIARFSTSGTVVSVDERKRRAQVNTGGMSLEVSLDELTPDTAPIAASTSAARVVRSANAPAAGSRLMLLGKRVDQAKAEVRRFLDGAFLERLGSVQIVHGYGTGALQDAVRELLTGHPLVVATRPGKPEEGGQGVTVVALKKG